MLLHLTHLTRIIQNCTSFLNSPNTKKHLNNITGVEYSQNQYIRESNGYRIRILHGVDEWINDWDIDLAKTPQRIKPEPITTEPITTEPKSAEAKTLYDVLEIPLYANDKQIIAGYHAKKIQLDSVVNKSTDTNNGLIFIQHAKEVLLDPEKRAAYNAQIRLNYNKYSQKI